MNIDVNKFVNVTTPLHAYILGLIWADGCVSKKTNNVRFDTTFPDALYFKEVFLKSGEWKLYEFQPKQKNWRRRLTCSFTNKSLKDFLCNKNYCSKNQNADRILRIIPKPLISYWVLGLVDGDGHVSANKKNGLYEIQIAGPVDQKWNFLEEYCKSLTCEYTIQLTKNKKGQGSIFRIIGRRNVYSFGESIWKQIEFGLPRKREKYNIIKKKYLSLSSKFPGVCYSNKLKKFKAYTPMLNGKKRLHLGYFQTQDEAFNAVQNYCKLSNCSDSKI